MVQPQLNRGATSIPQSGFWSLMYTRAQAISRVRTQHRWTINFPGKLSLCAVTHGDETKVSYFGTGR